MIEISIDLETADDTPTAALMAIGMAAKDSEFFRYVIDPGGSWSPNTMRWLARQDDPVSVVGDRGNEEHSFASLYSALYGLGSELRLLGALEEGQARIWSHATFDMPILEMAYRRSGLQRPWHYRNCRDLRTLYDFAGGRPSPEEVPHEGRHNALFDARAQLEEVRICLERIGV